MKKIVYIGNNLHSGNPTTLQALSTLFENDDFIVRKYASQKNKFSRLIAMFFGILKNTNANVVLIDTYSTSNFYYALIISQLCRLINLKYIPILHGGNLKERLLNNPRMSQLIFENSYKNVSPSEYLVKVFKNKKYNVQFIPNPINLSEYNFKNREGVQAKLLWVRAFDTIYNPQMAIEVLKELINEGIEAKLCMVGPDKDGSLHKIEELILAYNLESNVEITGYLTKKDWHKKAEECDVFINTTTIDNIPVSVIEAMALGLPVISTNVGGIPYLIEHGKNGLLVSENNVSEMSQSIINLIEDSNAAFEIAKVAREMIKPFDKKSVETEWKKLLSGQFS